MDHIMVRCTTINIWIKTYSVHFNTGKPYMNALKLRKTHINTYKEKVFSYMLSHISNSHLEIISQREKSNTYLRLRKYKLVLCIAIDVWNKVHLNQINQFLPEKNHINATNVIKHFHTYDSSHLEYCIAIWLNLVHIHDKLEQCTLSRCWSCRIQCRFRIRFGCSTINILKHLDQSES